MATSHYRPHSGVPQTASALPQLSTDPDEARHPHPHYVESPARYGLGTRAIQSGITSHSTMHGGCLSYTVGDKQQGYGAPSPEATAEQANVAPTWFVSCGELTRPSTWTYPTSLPSSSVRLAASTTGSPARRPLTGRAFSTGESPSPAMAVRLTCVATMTMAVNSPVDTQTGSPEMSSRLSTHTLCTGPNEPQPAKVSARQ